MQPRFVFSFLLATCLILGVVGRIPSAMAATITVTSTGDDNPVGANDGDCTLREAIDAANSNAAEDACPAGSAMGSDVITLAAGTYTRTVAGTDEDGGETGDLDILGSVTIAGAGPAATTVDANGIDRVFNIPIASLNVEVSGITIRGGAGDELDDDSGGGGGIFNEESMLSVTNAVFTGNNAIYGGAIANDGPGTLTITSTLITGNHAPTDVGGGLDIDDEMVAALTNVTVTGNDAQEGGGIWLDESSATLNNVTVTGNTATVSSSGGGIHKEDSPGDLTLRNTIVAGNTNSVGPSGVDCSGTISSQGYNLIGDNTGCTFAPATGDKVGTGAAPIDPKLGPLADNGGPTMTRALLVGSPAIDAGNPATPGSGGTACAATDQRGASRNCDMGAYERVLCLGRVVNRIGTSGNDPLVGTAGDDGFLGLGGNDNLKGSGGNDSICAGTGNDKANGGAGNDKINGEAGKDVLKGGAGKDKLLGKGGKDTCIGGGGKDRGTSCTTTKTIP